MRVVRPFSAVSRGALAALTWAAAVGAGIGEEDREGIDFFERNIRPVLVEHCYRCHSAEAEKLKGDFLLDTREGIRKGGASGRDAVIPGDTGGSQLLEAIGYGNEDLQMPPKERLPAAVVEVFEKWIASGAADPRDGVSKLPREIAAENHWAYQPLEDRKLPEVKNAGWPRDRIDRFILARLEEEGLSPVEDADRRTLIRRATLELTGLPPTPEEIEAFLSDKGDERPAFAKVVDRLLASEGFGVRWGRHWLDVARYGESSGYSRNMLYPYAWRYRNYVIDAFNSDKPFNEFVREQIAGDLLPAQSAQEADEHAIATGFLTIGAKDLGEGVVTLFHLNVADDQVDATCRAFLALTANCARCHDHKYDPISARDYYAMAGIFQSSDNLGGTSTNNRNEHEKGYALGPNGESRVDAIARATAEADEAQKTYMAIVAERNAIREPLEKEGVDWKKNPTPELVAKEAEVQRHQDLVRKAKGAIPPPPQYAMAVIEGKGPKEAAKLAELAEARSEEQIALDKKNRAPAPIVIRDSPLYDKGSHEAPLEAVPRGVPSMFEFECEPIGENESGRRQFADWIVDERNPLTARVFVNRVWHHLFGTGLVETPDNFGLLGAGPSHPELLDDLASRFMREGWSTKRLIRNIMLSRTYGLSATHDATAYAADPGGRLLWRFTPQRLEGEVVRDSVLFISGELDTAMLEGSQVAEIAETMEKVQGREIGRRDFYNNAVVEDVKYRTAYMPMPRSATFDFLTIFDAADPNLVVGARKLTTVPTQALYLMNSPIVLRQAEKAAKRVIERPAGERIDYAYEIVLGRKPTSEEEDHFKHFLAVGKEGEAAAWAQLCQTLFCSGEFRMVY